MLCKMTITRFQNDDFKLPVIELTRYVEMPIYMDELQLYCTIRSSICKTSIASVPLDQSL